MIAMPIPTLDEIRAVIREELAAAGLVPPPRAPLSGAERARRYRARKRVAKAGA